MLQRWFSPPCCARLCTAVPHQQPPQPLRLQQKQPRHLPPPRKASKSAASSMWSMRRLTKRRKASRMPWKTPAMWKATTWLWISRTPRGISPTAKPSPTSWSMKAWIWSSPMRRRPRRRWLPRRQPFQFW